MHFGEALEEDRYIQCIQLAYARGVRTFVTADVYGQGEADIVLGKALADAAELAYTTINVLPGIPHTKPPTSSLLPSTRLAI